MRNRKRTNRGGAVIEFALICPFWVALLLGTMWIGTAMVKGLQVQQAARDLASMFSRSVDFSSASGTSNEMLTDITQQLGTVTATGNGVVIFSTLTYVGNSVCAAAGSSYGVAGNGTPSDTGSHTGSCTNYGKFVFTQQYTQGNTSLRGSNWGSPLAADLDSSNSYRIDSAVTYVTHSGDATNPAFTLIPSPKEDGTDGYQSGQPVSVVEVFFNTGAKAGYITGANYAYAIF
jgi:Flp pilus assembly protein TadG